MVNNSFHHSLCFTLSNGTNTLFQAMYGVGTYVIYCLLFKATPNSYFGNGFDPIRMKPRLHPSQFLKPVE